MGRKKYTRRRYKKRKRYGRGLLGQDKWSRYFTKQTGKGAGLLTLLTGVSPVIHLLASQLSK